MRVCGRAGPGGWWAGAAAVAVLAVAGCKSDSAATPENLTKGLNKFLSEKSDCLFPESPKFPLETSDPAKTKQMNTLVKSQLLTASEERSIHVTRYTPTDIGAKAAPRFCYGHRVVTSIESFTPPTLANGFNETQVTYHYKLEDVPVWAKSDEVMAAFPKMAEELGGSPTAKVTMAQTAVGWQVPD